MATLFYGFIIILVLQLALLVGAWWAYQKINMALAQVKQVQQDLPAMVQEYRSELGQLQRVSSQVAALQRQSKKWLPWWLRAFFGGFRLAAKVQGMPQRHG